MDINQIADQLQSIATLYAEILISLAVASLLGLFVGLMMQRSKHRRDVRETNAAWEDRYRALEETARDDADNLEAQLQSLANETKSLQSANRALTDTLKKNDTNIQKARAEAIELNRQHTESHERLQRIIQQKDREILELGNRLNTDSGKPTKSASHIASAMAAPVKLTEFSEVDLNNADTIAISPGQLPSEPMDATIQMEMNEPKNASADQVASTESNDGAKHDDSFDDTSDMSDMALEESTIAMDDEALALVRSSSKGKHND